jgi:purine-binding chemotaxis protein CheW
MATMRQRVEPDKFVRFQVGGVAYAVPIDGVKEIVNPLLLTELPHAPGAVAGVADHRGEVVPVIDLRARFGLERSGHPERLKWILVDVQGRTVGLMVDQVTEVFAAKEAELRPAPELGGGEEQRGIVGVTTHQGAMVFVLDVERFQDLTRAWGEPGSATDEQEQV